MHLFAFDLWVALEDTVLAVFAGGVALKVTGLSRSGGPRYAVHALEAVLVIGAVLASSRACLALEVSVLEVTSRAWSQGRVGLDSTHFFCQWRGRGQSNNYHKWSRQCRTSRS